MKIGTDSKTRYKYVIFGGESFFAYRDRQIVPYPLTPSQDPIVPNPPPKNLRLLTLIWRMVKIFFRYGNQEIYYHICGSSGDWEVPMEAENVEVRLTGCGPKVTLW
jgi:hypothetical protein